jgi:steroid delta-isomerase-like uncharacterized protein
MANEENKAVVRRVFEEVWSQGNLGLVDQLLTPDVVDHDPSNPGFDGAEGQKRLVTAYQTAFPDIHFTVEDVIAEGDMAVARWTGTGTNNGNLMDMPATGKRASVTGITLCRLAGGKIAEMWTNYDALGMMQQLGLAPMPGQEAIPMPPHVEPPPAQI